MFQTLGSLSATLALLAGSLAGAAASAQTPVAGLQPYVNLDATMSPSGMGSPRAMVPQSLPLSVRLDNRAGAAPGDKLFKEAPAKDGGWQGLANVLQALTPSVDTDIPLSASQITDRINTMLNQGRNQAALDIIEKRQAQEQAGAMIGTDVQLLFLHARALAALGRTNEAIKMYSDMTTLYPELPEPWNNLAALYIKQGKLEMARDALTMALTANPKYSVAQANMGQVQLMLARQSFDNAAKLGQSSARAKAEQTQAILKK
ncbi:tetratricopeptide repeat protein [Paralcaligenes ureilyticus]|uniref:Tetratricopeptide repeat protein n=1 Tax=Paralcaligenes ureilyticus TaxID=627131 RepID=A0A4R3M8A3_9BURK|nr:tetratricopeptide repeat protein [Paralcaligenes ureilyticus]TCT09751.1 tetratricopeptide repeat protein [Paralcaligenes ureilyticus]